MKRQEQAHLSGTGDIFYTFPQIDPCIALVVVSNYFRTAPAMLIAKQSIMSVDEKSARSCICGQRGAQYRQTDQAAPATEQFSANQQAATIAIADH